MKKSLKILSVFLAVLTFFSILSAATPVFAEDVNEYIADKEYTEKLLTEVVENNTEEKAPIVKEIEEKREKNKKVYLREDGTYTAVISKTPIHYEKDGEWTYNYTEFSRLYAASNFKGCFTATNGKWVYTASSDLSFVAKNSKGEECIIKLKASDKGKKVYAGSSEDWDYEYNGYGYIVYIDNYDNYITIPETITVSLSQGGKELASLELKTDLNSVTGENFNLEKDSYNVSASFNLNGYEWNLSKLAYKAQGNSSVKLNLSKNDDVLLSMGASVDMTIDGDELTSAKNAQLSFDVLGKIKVAGSCSDIAKLSEKLEKADDNDENEGTYKSYISEANNLLKLKVYYDGTDQEQAAVRLEPFYDDYYGEWYSVLVICFEDGTSYSTFEAFFDETDFRNLIKALEKLVSDFDAL